MSLYKVGERLWVKQRGVGVPNPWIQSTVLAVESVPGPLGIPTFCYTLGIGKFYEMTLKNFDWMHRRTPKAPNPPSGEAERGGSTHNT